MFVVITFTAVSRVKKQEFRMTPHSLIGLFNYIIKGDKSGRLANPLRNVAGENFTRGCAARGSRLRRSRTRASPAFFLAPR